MSNDQIDCIVRFHSSKRIKELKRCIFSLVGQEYRPLNIILVTQRFTAEELAGVRSALSPMLSIPNSPVLSIFNYEKTDPLDARTELLNLGLSNTNGRYVAFLDYDDVIYPEAYAMLVGKLKASEAAIAFASVKLVKVNVFPKFMYVAGNLPSPFHGKGLRDLLRNNFCPIHSYVIDRYRVEPEVLSFDTSLTWEEDYELLLNVCARYPSDFSLLGTVIGDYCHKNDGSNSVPSDGRVCALRIAEFERVRGIIESRRKAIFLGSGVKKNLGLGHFEKNITIRQALDLIG